MKIAIASGKGGTGKTTIATNLAVVASDGGRSVAYVDCDVEEPNGHIFLQPQIIEAHPVTVSIPRIDLRACTGCGACAEICQFNAIVPLGKDVLVFPELCHSCGGCKRVCPAGAILEVPRRIGTRESGRAGSIQFTHGVLRVGEAMSPPLIRAVKAASPDADLTIIDVPPGTSCPVIESIRGSDFVVLVTEPTPFGLHDLRLAVEMVRILNLPCGVIINRAGGAFRQVHEYCGQAGVEILQEVPDDRRIAEAYSRGELLCREFAPLYRRLNELLCRLIERAA